MNTSVNRVKTFVDSSPVVLVKAPAKKKAKVSKAARNTVRAVIASIAASYLPIATYLVAHHETKANPLAWLLVIGGLTYSAPTLIAWAKSWVGHGKTKAAERLFWAKAVGFTGLLEGVMVGSSNDVLALCGLGILVLINASSAWSKASK